MDNSKEPLLRAPLSRRRVAPVLVLHGGAGILDRNKITPEMQIQYRHAISLALKEGHRVLHDGGEAIDAVAAAVTVMEDNPLFNAGKGAVFNRDGKNELEASVMLSKPPATHSQVSQTRRGFAATLLTRVRNPSQLVRDLYLSPALTRHVFLSGEQLEDYASAALGLSLVDPSYFWTEKRWREHRRGLGLPEEPLPYPPDMQSTDEWDFDSLPKGTVGAVALDANGCIASLTSTGGLTNKMPGRIGDTPLMGAGFWAEEWKPRSRLRRAWRRLRHRPEHLAVGVSGTGDGDYFIRLNSAGSVAMLMKYGNMSLCSATSRVIENLRLNGGSGGLIALDHRGNVSMPMNSPGMFRGVIRKDGVAQTAIFDDDVLS